MQESTYLEKRVDSLEQEVKDNTRRINEISTNAAVSSQQMSTIMLWLTEIKDDLKALKAEKTADLVSKKNTITNTFLQTLTQIITTVAIGGMAAAVVIYLLFSKLM